MSYQTVNSALKPTIRRAWRDGREYLVAPLVSIVPGVLPGSQGALYYPPEQIAGNPKDWDATPLTIGHPIKNGRNVSVETPGVKERQQVGFAEASRTGRGGRLEHEAWLAVDDLWRVSPETLQRLEQGRPVEVSTGLYTSNVPAPFGSVDGKGRAYDAVATNYVPDHIAILPDQQGACSLMDGCGLLVNQECRTDGWDWQPLANQQQGQQTAPAKRCDCVEGTPCACEEPAGLLERSAEGKTLGEFWREDVGAQVEGDATVWQLVGNAFCATGQGGGVDPSCSPDGGSGTDEDPYIITDEDLVPGPDGGEEPSNVALGRATRKLLGDKGVVSLKTPAGQEWRIRNEDDLREFLAAGGQLPKKKRRRVSNLRWVPLTNLSRDDDGQFSPEGAAGDEDGEDDPETLPLTPEEENKRKQREEAAASGSAEAASRVEEYLANGMEPDAEMRQAGAIKAAGQRLAKSGLAMPGYGQIFRNGDNDLWYVGGDGDERGFDEVVRKELEAVPMAGEVIYEAEGFPPRGQGWFQVYPRERVWNWQPIANADEGDGRWVTTEDGNRLYIGSVGTVHPGGPGSPARLPKDSRATPLSRAEADAGTGRSRPEVGASKPAGGASSREFSSGDDARAWAGRAFANWKPSDAEEEAIGTYQGATAFGVNTALRTPEKALGFQKRSAQQLTAGIDSAIAGNSLPEPVTVYRGLTGSTLAKATPGSVIEDKAYVSTSMDRQVAEKFANTAAEQGDEPAIAEIRLPKGHNAAWVDKVRDTGEAELLLARGSRFRVVSNDVVEGVRRVVLEPHTGVANIARNASPEEAPKGSGNRSLFVWGEGDVEIHSPKEEPTANLSWQPIANAEEGLPSERIDPDKACEILRDGSVHGEELTEAQRRMFGAACGEREGPTENGWVTTALVLGA